MGSDHSKLSAPADAPRLAKRIFVVQGEWHARLRRDGQVLFPEAAAAAAKKPANARMLSHPGTPDPAEEDAKGNEPSYVGAEREAQLDAADRQAPLAGTARSELLLAKYSLVCEALSRVEKLLAGVCRRMAYRESVLDVADADEGTSPERADHLRRVGAYVLEEAKRDMARHDQAVWAIDWMRKDYRLSVDLARLSAELEAARTAQAAEQENGPADPDADLPPSKAVRKLEKARSKAEKELAQHQLASLVVGLQLLDKNHSGYVEPSDLPGCPVELFARLDVSNNKKITASDMEAFVEAAGKRRDKATAARDEAAEAYEAARNELASYAGDDRVKRERYQVALGHRADELNAARAALKEEQGVIDQVYHIFGTVFSREVLDKLDLPMGDVRAKMDSFRADMDAEDDAVRSRNAPERQPTFGADNE